MGNPLYYILFSLIFGFFLEHSLLLIIFPLCFIVYSFFCRRLLISLSIALALLSGYLLSFDINPPILENGNYELEMDVRRSLRYDYIVSAHGMKILLKTDYSLFEGDKVYGLFKVKKIEGVRDYEKYLIESGIFHSAAPVEIDSVKSVMGIERIRTLLINKVKTLYPQEEISGFINSLLWGYRKDLNAALKKGFLHSGVIHLIAISGQHTTVIFSLIMALLFPLPVLKKIKMIFAGLIIIFYGYLTYLNPPVMRAVVFIIIIIIGSLSAREADNENMLMVVMMLMLVFNKSNFTDEGFMLSFIAVYGLLLTPKLCYSKRPVVMLIASSIIILLLTFPFMMFRFKYISIGSPVFTFLLLPLFNLMLPLSLISLAIPFSFISSAVNLLFQVTEKIVFFSENLPLFFNISIDATAFIFLFSTILLALNKKFKLSAVSSAFLFLYSLFRFSCL
ncbi:MAG: ComEC/Rec2 family competence protein [bacterium]